MTHEFDGERYAQASAHQREWGTRLIAELALRGHERVLDLGCGDGTLTAQLADLVPAGKVLGIDASRGMIEAALPKVGGNLQFRRLDIDDLAFVEEFDVVFSNAALHWVKDHRRLLANVHRALAPGGRLRFNFGGAGNCVHFFAVVREVMAWDELAPLFVTFEWPWYMPSVEEYRALMEGAWPGEWRVWGENADRYFPDSDALVRWIDQPSLVPFLAHLPGLAARRFRAVVVARMIDATRQADGRCFETFRRINVYAKKS